MAEIIVDPEADPTATYAVDPARVRALADRVVCGPRPEHFVTHTPLTGAPLASLPLSTRGDVEVALAGARAAQRAWGRTSFGQRERIMLRFHDLVLAQQRELLDFVQLESGKTRYQAFEEVGDAALTARHYARRAQRYLRPRRHAGVYPLLTRTVEEHLPKGVVGVVSPWNYPLAIAVGDAIPALMAGNAVVLRPDPQGSLSALLAVRLLHEAGLPDGVLKVVLGPGPVTGQAVVDLADYVCFTGSTATGRLVATSAATRLAGFSLELGGKNSAYVTDDVDLGYAVRGVVKSSFSSAGQLCVSTERVILHEAIAEEFTARLVKAIGELRMGTALAYGYDVGSLVSAQQLARVTAHVEDARAKGARVLAGGRARPDVGPYVFEPTVLTGVTAEMDCRDEETFGPVVALYTVRRDAEAVALANDTPYGLNAAIFTGDVSRGRRIARQIHAGTVNINEGYAAAWGSTGAPMGGMKDSGMGRRHGGEGILKYTEPQTVSSQHLVHIGPTLGLTDEQFAAVMTRFLRVLKIAGRA